MEGDEFRRAISYFRAVPIEGINNVYLVGVVGDIATVSYTGPKGKVRTNEFNLSKQYMKMFLEIQNDREGEGANS